MSIIIDNKWLNLIRKVLAYPDVDNLLLSDDEIKDLCVFPALQKYFTKFPIKEQVEYAISSEMKIDFPDEYTFGVTDARITDIGMIGGTGGTFWDIVQFQSFNGTVSGGRGSYGKRDYNPSGLQYQRDNARHQYKSYQNAYVTNKVYVDINNKQLIAYTSNTGKLNITWAKYSDDFSNVRFERRDDVIKLCQAELLMHLADSSSILVDSALEVTINSDTLRDRAKELFEAVETKWSEWPDVIFIHAV